MNINLTLIFQCIAFLLFAWFCMQWVWPPILASMEERRRKIAEGVAAAEKSAEAQQEAEAKVAKVLDGAKEQASELVGAAQKTATDAIEQAKARAKAEGDRILEDARQEIETEVVRARDALSGEVVDIAVNGAGKVLSKTIDANKYRAG